MDWEVFKSSFSSFSEDFGIDDTSKHLGFQTALFLMCKLF